MSDERKRKRESGRPDLPPKEKDKRAKDAVEKAKIVNRDTADFEIDIVTEPAPGQEKLIEAPIVGANIEELEDVEDYELDPGRDVGKKKEPEVVTTGGVQVPVGDFDPMEYELDLPRMVVEDEDEKEEDEDE